MVLFIYIISVSAKQLHCKYSVLNETHNQIKKANKGLYKSLERFCFVKLIILPLATVLLNTL
jgi:hypothetical protein